jgi:hypothetical protein
MNGKPLAPGGERADEPGWAISADESSEGHWSQFNQHFEICNQKFETLKNLGPPAHGRLIKYHSISMCFAEYGVWHGF